jgi:hypothetical protein
VEDRLTPALYLELSTQTPQAYGRERVSALAGVPGVERLWWWANANPGRTDLPRRLEEFATLGLAEVGSDFVAPEGAGGLLFARTSRPAQGVLTGRATTGLLFVLISPRDPADAQALRDWADFIHIRHIAAAAVPGYAMITPYERSGAGGAAGGEGAPEPRFLHLYEIDDGEPEQVFTSMVPMVIDRIGRPGTPAFDQWAGHPSLRIEYVNTFALAGSRVATGQMADA